MLKNKNESKKGLIVGAGVLAVLLVAGAMWLKSGSGNGEAQAVAQTSAAALTVRAVRLEPRQWDRTLAANGSIVPWQEAVIGAELSGVRIAEVKVNVGDHVRRGELLATLASDTQRASEAESRAALAESEALLAEASANARRAHKLGASGFFSEQQVIKADTAEQTARARVEVQRAKLQANQLRLAQTRIVAPDDGVISASSATVGTLTQSGAELFRLIRRGRLEWHAELIAEELAQVRKGMPVELSTASGQIVQGKVRAVAPEVNAKTRYGTVLVELPDNAKLVAGMFTRGVIKLQPEGDEVQTLPQSAVVQRGNAAYVFVITPQHKVEERRIGIGRRSGDRIEIASGLEPSTEVVESGGAFLTDGDQIMLSTAH